ncbi:hypothetical protein SLS53_002189 [Cytospora paraplurivora]|uniref:Uncharacterized protein n=1 Tax=Cytospora paraplurivora TaxID=2898453 RepID=A0AAN9UG85_9PEZI
MAEGISWALVRDDLTSPEAKAKSRCPCIRVKRKPRTDVQRSKSAVEDDRAIVLEFVQFRDKEYPKLARSYFHDHLRQRVDFHNVFAVTKGGRRVEELEKVVVSAKLNMRMAAALGTFGMKGWGDVSEGCASPSIGRPATPEAPFSARLFLERRYSDAWSVIEDGASTRCPDTPDGVESIDDEDETLIADDEQHQEEQGDGEWEYIGKNEVREACDEEAEMANRPTGTQTDGLLPKDLRSALTHISPDFSFYFAWHIIKLSMPSLVKFMAGKLNKVSNFKRRSKAMRSYKPWISSRTKRRVKLRGPIGLPVRLAVAGTRWILRQVSKVLRRVGKMLVAQDSH